MAACMSSYEANETKQAILVTFLGQQKTISLNSSFLIY